LSHRNAGQEGNGSCRSFSCTSGKQSAKSPAHGILTYTIQFKMDLEEVFPAPAAYNQQKVQLTAI
jgi:hypothetical protein